MGESSSVVMDQLGVAYKATHESDVTGAWALGLGDRVKALEAVMMRGEEADPDQ
jgi:hypothetical protein